MPEPIAVAFVEVRPSVDDFKGAAERELQADLGSVDVQGQVRLQGLAEAKADVGQLTRDLQGISGQQLQFPGLEDARLDAVALGDALQDATSVSVRSTFDPLLQDVSRLKEEARSLSDSLSGLPTQIIPEQEGIAEAIESTEALDVAQQSLGDTIGTSATAAGALIARYPQLISGERQVAAATAASNAETRQAIVQEERLGVARLKARRASSLGPFRIAGIGLGVGTALFAATQAVGALGEALEVTGNDALTAGGRLRNVASSVLRGDLLGAVGALTNQTRDYSKEQLLAISRTEGLEEALSQMGQEANLARSRLQALQEISANPVPQVVETAITRAQLVGDPESELRNVRAAGAAIDRAINEANTVGGRVKQLRADVRRLSLQRQQVNEELARQRGAGRDQIPDGPVPRLENQASALGGAINDLRAEIEQRRNEVSPALNELFKQRKANKEEQKRLIEQAQADRADRVSGVIEAFADRRLAAELKQAAGQVAAINKEERERLREILAEEKRGTQAWRDAAARLKAINLEEEQAQAALVAEAERHRQAMIDARLAPSEEAIVDAQLSGSGEIAALQQRANAIEAILSAGMINGKKLSRDQRVALKNELVSINGQIEAAQDAITAENQRHADAMKEKLSQADQAFLDAIQGREQRARNRQILAQSRAGLGDDIRVSNELQRIFQESIAQARKRITDAKVRADTIAGLTTQLLQEQANERGLRAQQRQERVSRREESLDLDIQIAQAGENVRAELRAHRAKIAFLRERIRHTREGTNQRKRLILEIRQEQAAIRELLEAGKDTAKESAASFAEMAAAFITQRQGFLTEFASNVIPTGAPAFGSLGPRVPTPVPPPKPPPAPGSTAVRSPFDRRSREGPEGESGRPDAVTAAHLRESGGAPATQGQLETLIHVTRNTNRLLGDIRRGVGHQEAKTSRALSKNAVEVGGV